MKKETSIPISQELAAVIVAQQEFVKSEWGLNCPFLFTQPKAWCKGIGLRRKGKPIFQKNVNKLLNELAIEKNICDSSGKLWHFESHQFRHTVGTTMINNGVTIHIVQRYLGHETLEMTMRYTHIFSQTLKEEFIKFKDKMVDVTGKFVSDESIAAELTNSYDPNSFDAQWLKKNIRSQALPNGLCALTINQPACPYGANKCLTGTDGKGCSHFKTDVRYLNMHQEHLRRTNENIKWAQENLESKRSQEIIRLSLPIKQSLERIITTLENQQNAQ